MPQNDCAFMLSLTRDPDESIVQTTSDAIAGCSAFHDRGRKTFFIIFRTAARTSGKARSGFAFSPAPARFPVAWRLCWREKLNWVNIWLDTSSTTRDPNWANRPVIVISEMPATSVPPSGRARSLPVIFIEALPLPLTSVPFTFFDTDTSIVGQLVIREWDP